MAHGVRTSRNTLWHLSLPLHCLCTASQLSVGPLWRSCSWSILSLALFFVHGLQGIQSVSLEAGLGDAVYLGRDVKGLEARSGYRAAVAWESMGTQSRWWVSREGCWLGMAMCPGTVRMCVSMLFVATMASGSAAMLQHTAPSATLPLHPRGRPPACVLGISPACWLQCLCTSNLKSALFPSTSLLCTCSPPPAVFLAAVHSASLVFQCLPGVNCSGGPARGCSHQTPPR